MSPSPDAPVRRGGEDLADYASFLRRRWLIVLSLFLTGAGGGIALMWLTPPSYTASGQVLVTATGAQEQTNQVTSRQREPLNLDTEAQVARSAVVEAKARRLFDGLSCPAEVSVPPNTSVLEISCSAADPATAASGASAYALAYLAQRRESSAQTLAAQTRAVLVKLRQTNAGLTRVATELPGLGRGTTERTLALQRQNVLARQVHSLTSKYDALKTVAVTPGSVISQATAPAEPTTPRPPLYLGSGLMAGLICGVGAAWLRDRLDTARRPPAAVGRLTGLDTLDGVRAHGPAGAVLVVATPGTSPREVKHAVRALNDRGIPVVGTFVIGDDVPSLPAGRGSHAARAPQGPYASQGPTPQGPYVPQGASAPRAGGGWSREGAQRRADRPLAGLAGGPALLGAPGESLEAPARSGAHGPPGTPEARHAPRAYGNGAHRAAERPEAPKASGGHRNGTRGAAERPEASGGHGNGARGAAERAESWPAPEANRDGARGPADGPEVPLALGANGNVPTTGQAADGRRGRRL
ncbi:Wzz/FepE/Etk N-terminal domain-containing protein [Streptosporangium sp. NPDC049046]|uniref:Wzz/FepE/Etk N-terminal domain-containing protein n=1 Tax=unclassified Streptosporangium TaxID=2632669 RepID=UPI003442EB36